MKHAYFHEWQLLHLCSTCVCIIVCSRHFCHGLIELHSPYVADEHGAKRVLCALRIPSIIVRLSCYQSSASQCSHQGAARARRNSGVGSKRDAWKKQVEEKKGSITAEMVVSGTLPGKRPRGSDEY